MIPIQIFTMCTGGPLRLPYLRVCCSSLAHSRERAQLDTEHTVFFQGHHPSDDLRVYLGMCGVKCVAWEKNIGRALGQVRALKELPDAKIILRTDDDARFLEEDFIDNMMEIHEHVPGDFINAAPVGLMSTLGGPACIGKRRVVFGKKSNHLYSLRPVGRCGGLARAAASEVWKKVPWRDDLPRNRPHGIESEQLSRHCKSVGIRQFYVENRWVVEHQDATWGQLHRRKVTGDPE